MQKCLLATYYPCCTVYWWLLVYFRPGNETIHNINVGNFPRLWNTAGVNFSSLNLEKLIGLHTINNPSRIFLVYLEGTSPLNKLSASKEDGQNEEPPFLLLTGSQSSLLNKGCVTLWPCHLHFKSILKKKKNYGNSNISPCENIIFRKSSTRNQNPSRYIITP